MTTPFHTTSKTLPLSGTSDPSREKAVRGIEPRQLVNADDEASSNSKVELPENPTFDEGSSGMTLVDPSEVSIDMVDGLSDAALTGSGPNGDEEADDATSKPDIDQVIVAEHFVRENLQVFADDTIRRVTDINSASNRGEMARYLKQDRVDDHSVVDHIASDLKKADRARPIAELRRALRHFKKERKKSREAEILERVFGPLSQAEKASAATSWERLGMLFETGSELAVPVIKHFIWQVGQKVLGRPVTNHLMPVIYSRSQGSGKTTFVMRLIGPMQELASDPVALNDIADIRSGSIFEFPVIPVDDMEEMDPKKMATFKAAMTANAMRRRRLGSSSTVKVRQRATFIGTANHTADDLVMDDTGNRRFVTLTFRNGNTDMGGEADVWETVSALDYLLLWRSVDPFQQSPLNSHLGALAAYQSRHSPAGRLRAWAMQLDLHSDVVLNCTPRGGIPSRKLWQLYVDQTGSEVSETWFSRTLSQLTTDPMVPFDNKYSTGKVRIWPIKSDHLPSGCST